MTRVLAILLILLSFSVEGRAEDKALRGVALVIGQSEYTGLPALANPVNDARAIEGLLEDLGFEVTGVTDRDARKLRRDLERFVEDAEGADAAIIYYSGHGIEAGGENWLVPVDADPKSLENVAKNLVPLSSVLDDLRTTVPLTIFLIDACRSNPFPPGMVAREAGKEVPMCAAGVLCYRSHGDRRDRNHHRFRSRTRVASPRRRSRRQQPLCGRHPAPPFRTYGQ